MVSYWNQAERQGVQVSARRAPDLEWGMRGPEVRSVHVHN